MATTTNYGWTTPDDTSLVKDGASAIRTLGSAIDTSLNTALGTKKAGLVLLNTTSFSAVSAVNLSAGTFSATYQNYRILFVFGNSTSISHSIRLRVGGTDASGSNYNTKGLFSGSTGSVGNINTAGGTSWYGFTTSGGATITLDLYRPFDASTTLAFGTHYGDGSGDQRLSHLDHSLTTSYDALSLICSTGNITGTVRVYGYNQ